MHGIGRIPDEVGHLVLSEDGAIIASGGELENAEQLGATIMSLLSCTSKAQLWPGDSGEAFKKISRHISSLRVPSATAAPTAIDQAISLLVSNTTLKEVG